MLTLYGREVSSRLLLGTARYPSPAVLADAVRASNTDILTISLRRETAGGKKGGQFFELIRELDCQILPNTAGCFTAAFCSSNGVTFLLGRRCMENALRSN